MAENKDGGDIASGFGDSTVDGPVSDEKAQKMLHDDVTDTADAPTDSAFAVSSDGTVEREASDDSDGQGRPDAAGGGGGGGW